MFAMSTPTSFIALSKLLQRFLHTQVCNNLERNNFNGKDDS